MQTRNTSRLAAVTAGAVLTALLAAGCHDDTPPTVVTTPTPSGTTTVVPGGTPASVPAPGTTATTIPDTKVNTNAGPGGSTGTDKALADQINTAIVHNKQMTGSRVEVVATVGIVTLNGQVQNQQQKALAQSTAAQVPGVSADSIKNKLIIVTTGGPKPKPMVVTKTKTVVVHDQAPTPVAPPADAAAPTDPSAPATVDQNSTPPAPPATGGTTGQ